ncbi:MAG: acetate--CoA ligase family protein [Bacillota bacterium]
MENSSSNPLFGLMEPKTIATVGAGNNPMKMGAIQALSIVKDGFSGKYYPIHPTEKEVFGYRAYPSAYDLPETPDLVMFVLPAPLVVQILEDFGKIGTKRAIVITAGFRETGPRGHDLEEQLKDVARRYGIRFLGPNCMGILNSHLPLNVTVAPLAGPPGLLGMVSQSGTYITQTLPYLRSKGIRFSKAISVGNEADIDIIDCLEYLGADQDTKAISLYIEGLKDAGRLLETARRITPHKPVLVQYVGGTDAGARAGSSHTGAMAGPDYLYDGLFKQAGIIRVDSIEELYNQGWVLATQPRLKGKRLAVLTNSGGPGTAMANTCNDGGMEVPAFSDELQAEIKKHIPPHGSAGNPVDLTFHMDSEAISTTIPELILKSGEVDGLVVHGLMSSGFLKAVYPHLTDLVGDIGAENFAAQFARDMEKPLSLSEKYGLPMVFSSFFGREDNFTTTYQDHNIPFFDGPEKAARGMLALHRYNQVKNRPSFEPYGLTAQSEQAAQIITGAREKGWNNLDEYNSKLVLRAYGIPVNTEMLANSALEAVQAADRIGYPVVLKGCSPHLVHKTGQGLIQLNLNSKKEVRDAYDAVLASAGQDMPVLVSKMIKGDREVMAGMIRRQGFGSCVLFGLGGIFTEALKDNTFRLAPLCDTDASEMIDTLRSSALLGAYRGLQPVNRSALSKLLQTVGNIGLLHPEISEIDLNPIIISGSEPVIVDALIVMQRA